MNLLTKEQNENILDVEVEEVEYVVDFVDTDSDDSESTSVDVLGEKELESQLIADVKTDIQQMLSLVNRDTYVGEVDSFKDTCQAIMRTAETKSITELFENTLYIIPCLQRVYEWQPSKEVKTMLDDIRQAYRNGKVGYSLTDILVYNPSFQNSIKKSKGTITYVYDGQQRITTLILILIFLRDVFCFLKGQIEKDALLNSNSDLKDELNSMCENGVYEISELLIHNQIVKGEVISESLYQNIVYSDFTQLINYLMKSEGIVFSKEFKEIKENKFIASENVELVSENCTRAINILAYLRDTYSDFKLVLNAKSNAFSLEEKVNYFNYFTKVLLETVMVTVLQAKSEVEATIFYVRKNSRGKAMNPYEGMHCEAQVLNTPDSVRENFSSYIRDFDAKFKKDTSWELTSHIERPFLKGLFTNLLGGHATNENTLVNEITSTLRSGNTQLNVSPIKLKLVKDKNVYADDFVEDALLESFNGLFVYNGSNYISWHKSRIYYRECLKFVLDVENKDELYKQKFGFMKADVPTGKWVSVLASICWCWGIDKALFNISEVIDILTGMYLFFISAKDSINSTLLDDMFDGLACNIVRNFILGEHVSIEDTMDYIKTFASKRRCLKDGSPVTSENFNIGFNTKLASAKLGGSLLRGYEFIMQPSKYKPSEDKSSKGKSYSFIQVSDSLSGDMAITYNVKWLALPITGKNNKVGLNTAEDLYSKVRLNVLSDFPHVGKLYLDCIGLNLTEDNLNAFGNEVSRVFKSYLNIS